MQVFARIKSLAEQSDALRTGISPSDAALTLGIAPALAKEHLLTAETRGAGLYYVSSVLKFCRHLQYFQVNN